MIKTFSTYDQFDDTHDLDNAVNSYLRELKAKGIKYTIQTSSAATEHIVYNTVTVISEK